MAERWLLAEPGALAPDVGRIALDPVESHHARSVLRLRGGDRVVVADGRGRLAVGAVCDPGRGRVEVELEEVREYEPAACDGPVLAHGVLAGRGMDWAVQKAVEIGVPAVRPVLAARSQLAARAVRGRLEHWRRIARQAIKQCHRVWEMELLEPADVATVVAAAEGRGAVADPDGEPLWAVPGTALELLLVGPEGGLDAGEIATAVRHGWARVRLGPHVLRSETAAVVGAAAVALERQRRAAGGG
jgi:16S rRNA (uracil1498-N3)-methyltransferase